MHDYDSHGMRYSSNNDEYHFFNRMARGGSRTNEGGAVGIGGAKFSETGYESTLYTTI